MIQAICLKKFRNKNNQIIGYKIQDKNGSTLDVKSEYLKQAIRNNQINVLNLTLTSDNKLIDKAYKPQKQQKSNSKDIISKIKLLGKPITSPCGHTYYILEKSGTTIAGIPSDVKRLNPFNSEYNILKLIGGSGLDSTERLFAQCKAKYIDLSYFDTSKVTNMHGMFYECKAQSINLSSFNTSNVTDMGGMFCECEAQSIDLRSFDTSNVKDMEKMFYKCKAQSIDLTSFDTSNVRPMWNIFNGCKAQIKVNDPKLKEHLKSRR